MAKGVPIHKLTQPDAPLRESATVLLVRMQEMYDWSPAIHHPENVDDLHNMRIAAKRLRYTMELFAPCFGPAFAAAQKTVEEIQERIGAIHDCDVLIPLLRKTLDKETEREKKQALRKGGGPPPFLAAEGLVPLITRKQAEREQLYRDFLRFWDGLPPQRFFETLTAIVQGTPPPVPPPGEPVAGGAPAPMAVAPPPDPPLAAAEPAVPPPPSPSPRATRKAKSSRPSADGGGGPGDAGR